MRWVRCRVVSDCGQERNKMKLKGADLEHEQHEALVMHYQVMLVMLVMHYQVKILGLPQNPRISNAW